MILSEREEPGLSNTHRVIGVLSLHGGYPAFKDLETIHVHDIDGVSGITTGKKANPRAVAGEASHESLLVRNSSQIGTVGLHGVDVDTHLRDHRDAT